MTAAAEGTKSTGGQTVGILPEVGKSAANEFIDIAGAYRNALLVRHKTIYVRWLKISDAQASTIHEIGRLLFQHNKRRRDECC